MNTSTSLTAVLALGLACGVAAASEPVAAGGGEFVLAGHGDSPSPAVRRQIEALILNNRAALLTTGALSSGAGGSAPPVALDLPLRAAPGLTAPGFHGVSNFVDQNASYPDAVEDYTCGERTYDLGNGYNHPGTDYFLWPFAWRRMDLGVVEVVAAAPGVIVLKQDGNFDRSCGGSGAGAWNAVYVEHADGTVAWYGHLKSGSLTAKAVGQPVARGEFLGRVGSSGASSGPHLHFELHGPAGEVVDPYEGSCNGTITESRWSVQPEYYDSALNELATHSAPPVFPGCPEPEQPNYRDRFEPGQTAWFAAYYRDQLAGQVSHHTVRRPDGTVFATWDHEIPDPYYGAAYWYWGYALPPNAPTGEWSFEVDYLGTVDSHRFRVEQTLFSDGFESGDIGAWSQGEGPGGGLLVMSAP